MFALHLKYPYSIASSEGRHSLLNGHYQPHTICSLLSFRRKWAILEGKKKINLWGWKEWVGLLFIQAGIDESCRKRISEVWCLMTLGSFEKSLGVQSHRSLNFTGNICCGVSHMLQYCCLLFFLLVQSLYVVLCIFRSTFAYLTQDDWRWDVVKQGWYCWVCLLFLLAEKEESTIFKNI